MLVTGGAGFIGSNLTSHLLRAGHRVTVFDNLSRRGVARNVDRLRAHDLAGRLRVLVADVRDRGALAPAMRDVDVVYHLAAQVAVTTSVSDPITDFEVNALGTLNVLETARASGCDPVVVFTSTNKVYGAMDDVELIEKERRYEYANAQYQSGIDETRALDFHSPYGCSKGAADQYVRDYYRIYGLRTTVFRMSCIYGPHQFGNEDQGWLAHFVIAAALGLPISIYGDGKQVRDILFVEDLVRALELVAQHPERVAGHVYNVGGGAENTIAVWAEFGPLLEELTGKAIQPAWNDWRPGDQLIYVSDTAQLRRSLNWSPRVSVQAGLERLHRWVVDNRAEIAMTMEPVIA